MGLPLVASSSEWLRVYVCASSQEIPEEEEGATCSDQGLNIPMHHRADFDKKKLQSPDLVAPSPAPGLFSPALAHTTTFDFLLSRSLVSVPVETGGKTDIPSHLLHTVRIPVDVVGLAFWRLVLCESVCCSPSMSQERMQLELSQVFSFIRRERGREESLFRGNVVASEGNIVGEVLC